MKKKDEAYMTDSYNIAYIGGSSEVIEKKSRFIGQVFPIESEEEALEYIEQVRKQYYDARHHCYAYVFGINNEVIRSSDDGEPSQTAGKPILDVILGAKLHNVLVVVTRYFGGTLLGTGGLVRAYGKAAKEAITNSTIITKCHAVRMQVITDYNFIGKLNYIANQMEIPVLGTDYQEMVKVEYIIEDEFVTTFINKVTEASGATAKLNQQAECYYAKIHNELLLFER